MSMDGPGAPAERRWGLRERARLLAPATALVVLAAGATTLLLARRSPPGWSAVPTPVPAGSGAGAAARCQRLANQVLEIPSRIGGTGAGTGAVAVSPGIVHPVVLAERRGSVTGVVLGDAGTEAVCIDTGGGGMARMERVQALGRGVNLSVHDGGVFSSGRCLHPTHPPSHAPCAMTDARSLSSMDGQVAPTASRVSIRTIDGRSVHASVGGGFFLAWCLRAPRPRASPPPPVTVPCSASAGWTASRPSARITAGRPEMPGPRTPRGALLVARRFLGAVTVLLRQ